jgi:hypothetical protein
LIALGDDCCISCCCTAGLAEASCLGDGIGTLGRRIVELFREGSSTRVARAGTGDTCLARLISACP